jgi:CheY-like chemotaxis protein
MTATMQIPDCEPAGGLPEFQQGDIPMKEQVILVVDDEPYVIRSLRFVLKREGYQVETAANGKEALRKIIELRPALVILDLCLPIMDGYQVCRKVKGDPTLRDIYILVLSAKGQEHERREALSAGADHYISKPYSPKELIRYVRELFQSA